MRQKKRKKREGEKEKSTVQARTKRTKIYVWYKVYVPGKTSQLRQAGCVRASSELMSWCVCYEMCQCALRLISMHDLTLCVEVLCVSEWSTSLKLVDWPGAIWRKFRCKTPSATFATCISITYFTNQGNSHILHNQNQANVTIIWKETSLTKLSWVWVQGTSQHDNRTSDWHVHT